MSRKKLTVYDYLQCKGKRQLSVIFVHNADEARAAEEAGIDMICTSHDAPQFGIYNSFDELKRIREAAPTCFMQSGTASNIASEYDAMKVSHKYLEIGADVIYGGNWSYKIIRGLRDENIPINSHVGLVPGKATWIGGFRAIGKTADEAAGVLKHTLELQEAGAIGVELEVVPPKVAEVITKKVEIMTLSMGSGSGCDGQYLFANDVLGYTEGHIPRHARIYKDFKKEYARLQEERVNAFKEFHKDTTEKNFNDPKITVGIEDKEFEKFLTLIEKI
ncbi:MAG: 3-methyl-2-oxobutanoate hydroxymethyltransferase [Alphaproteobacteria bacterium MarineAlpha5_Bin6]|nr:MAG: 3-methyl-2-oxobutanoate hydroxymethyltransferase [Alphaproteobacteria bacterium MarineAlpha5_Bin7]PPR54847.1 MAG: 3-methyl-2-oxobutanoate hydroxymethyltransferase [Alphaproteobacteria bacterium MarineAlpha5_Bin6]|tara:strand:- start:678 stop:1505 length:828 start_codon:yes stop_codon:yes gene_type:complete